LSTILGSTEIGNQLIAPTGDLFLSRGHLTARVDFVFATQQQATFWLTNAAPQWQTFNGGNWNTLEMNVRTFIGQLNRDLIMYTGTWVSK
jgi:DNA/RNA endonuclease G (NUC1)